MASCSPLPPLLLTSTLSGRAALSPFRCYPYPGRNAVVKASSRREWKEEALLWLRVLSSMLPCQTRKQEGYLDGIQSDPENRKIIVQMILLSRHWVEFPMDVRCCLYRNFGSASSSPPLVPVQLPSAREAHLWYVVPDEVRDASLLSRYMDILSPCERENVLSFRGEGLKKAAILARALVRTTISRYQINGHVNPGSLKFQKNKYGKPELLWEHDLRKPEPELQFNLSHTSSLIACAVAVNSLIGIDVEEKQRKLKSNLVSFAQRYFTPHEVKVLSLIRDPELQQQHFIKLWTLKESYVKALGRGFSAQPFKNFTIRVTESENCDIGAFDSLDDKVDIGVECVDDCSKLLARNWEFALVELMGSHYTAVCMENSAAHQINEGSCPIRLTVRKTIPFVKDELVSGTDVIDVTGFREEKEKGLNLWPSPW